MSPYLQIPQTPSAKMQFEEHVDELVSGSDRTASQSTINRPLSPSDRAADAEEIARYRRKTASPSGNGDRLEPSDAFHRLSIGSFSDAGYGPPVSPLPFRAFSPSRGDPPLPPSSAPAPSQTRLSSRIPFPQFWARNKPVLLVFFAQLFGALMNLFARLLELEGDHGFHPVQLLFIRMVVTATVSCLYMYRYKVPHFPLGPPGVRLLLVARGVTGFFGIFGMWYSMMYLPLAEATVFTFLSPSVTGYICHVLLKDPFTRKEQIASVVAFAGIILITRPLSFFSSAAAGAPIDGDDIGAIDAVINATAIAMREAGANATAAAEAAVSAMAAADSGGVSTLQRLIAICVALLGVLGGSLAFTSIRAIGTRAHPLISVNYFSTWCTIVTGTVLTFAPMLDIGQPHLQFALPNSLRQWLLLFCICICGFCTQFLATMGLGLERSNRATAMVYTQMLFAASFDRFVFGHEMGPTSLVGGGLIIGSALWAALSKKPAPDKTTGAAAAAATTAPSASYALADIEIGVIDTTREGHHDAYRRTDVDAANVPSEEGVPMLAAEESEEEDDDDELDRGRRSTNE